MAPDTTNPDEHLLPVKHGNGDLFICDVADAALKDLIPQMEHPFYSLSKKRDIEIRRYEQNARRRMRQIGILITAYYAENMLAFAANRR